MEFIISRFLFYTRFDSPDSKTCTIIVFIFFALVKINTDFDQNRKKCMLGLTRSALKHIAELEILIRRVLNLHAKAQFTLLEKASKKPSAVIKLIASKRKYIQDEKQA